MPLEKVKLEKYVADRRRIAETYLGHGLVQESRNIYSALLQSIHRIQEKTAEPLPSDQMDFLRSVQDDLHVKLQELDSKLNRLKESTRSSSRGETGASDTEKSANYLFQRGVGLKELGLMEEAAYNFRKAYEKGYDPYPCMVEIYRCLTAKGSLHDLIRDLESAVGAKSYSGSQQADLLHRLGFLYEKMERPADAMSSYNRALEANPNLRPKLAPKIASLEKKTIPQKRTAEMHTGRGPEANGGPREPEAPKPASVTEELTMEKRGSSEESAEIARLKHQAERLSHENKELRTLLEEYQKRYQDILNFSTTLQKENRELHEKLEAGDSSRSSKKKP